jgi:hypothetical protein
MSRRFCVVLLSAAAVVGAVPASTAAHAQNNGPVFVVPARPGVPVVLHGRDVSYVVVEGDWGLARPGHMTPSIIGYAPPVGDRASPLIGLYHPRYGAPPPRGRFEVEAPHAPPPEPAETYRRAWSTVTEPVVPADGSPRVIPVRPLNPDMDVMAPALGDPQAPPPIVVVPRLRRR